MRGITLLLLGALAGCGGSQPAGKQPWNANPKQQGPTNAEKLAWAAAGTGVAVAETLAYRAITGECYAICAPPTVCDRASGLCVAEGSKKKPLGSSAAYPDPNPPDAPAAPTCGGLCLADELCVVKDGQQDCVPKAPAAPPP